MTRKWLIGGACAVLIACNMPLSAGAMSLRIAPVIYKDAVLQGGESKKGYVDVTNPGASSAQVAMDVKAFRQIDDQGGLEFYESESVRAGVKLDLDHFELKSHETMRVYFLLDGKKLPSGDVFAAIFARVVPRDAPGSSQTVQVGTLLMIQNGTSPSHRAEVQSLQTAWWQFGDKLTANVRLKNPADEKSNTGFTPKLQMSLRPYTTKTVDGPLLFAGRTRDVSYTQPGDYFGPILLEARAGDSTKSQWIFAVTGYWRWLAPLMGVLIVVLGVLTRRYMAWR